MNTNILTFGAGTAGKHSLELLYAWALREGRTADWRAVLGIDQQKLAAIEAFNRKIPTARELMSPHTRSVVSAGGELIYRNV